MDERCNMQDLAKILAEKQGIDIKEAEDFVKGFFLLIEEALRTDRYVNVKGLGTFKLIDVDDRELAHSKESLQAKGRAKICFTPDAALSDTINRPFAHFETVVLNANTVLEDTPIEEDGDDEEFVDSKEFLKEAKHVPLAESESSEVHSKVEVTESKLETEESENVLVVGDELAEEKKILVENSEQQATLVKRPVAKLLNGLSVDEIIALELQKTAALLKSNPADSESNSVLPKPASARSETTSLPPETASVPLGANSAKTKAGDPSDVLRDAAELKAKGVETPSLKPKSPNKPSTSNKSMTFLAVLVIFTLLLCGGAVFMMYYPDLFSSTVDEEVVSSSIDQGSDETVLLDSLVQEKDTISQESVMEEGEINKNEAVELKAEPAQPAKKEVLPAKKEIAVAARTKEPVRNDSSTYKIVGTKATHVVAQGETLTRVSLKFYGTKACWPYIVKHNPDVIKNPNNVPYGTKLKIPELVQQ